MNRVPAAVRFRKQGNRYIAETRCRGIELSREPLLNKGSGFTLEERRRLQLEGLLPSSPKTMQEQADRIIAILRSHAAPIDRYAELAALQDRNEHLFYRVLRDHLEEFMPIVYTPTVGEATQRFSSLFRRGRGLWITPGHRGRIREVLGGAGRDDVRLIVATDNESILGIGDQGAGGIAISVGKLSLYCAAAGLHPAMTLPISLDVGTDNETLLKSPDYVGWPERRLRGAPYEDLLDEFVAAVGDVFPRAVLQWEDLRNENALHVLDRYHDTLPSFNDDIQGTGAMAAAGALSAARISGVALGEQRYVVFGAGAAGLGIDRQLRELLGEAGVPAGEQRRRIAVLDSKGLIVEGGPTDHGYKAELAMPRAAAAELGLAAGMGLAQVVAQFAPHGVIGTSGVPRTFTQPIVEMLARQHERPLILPLSNPTSLCEALPVDLIRWSDGRAIVATGSPFEPVHYGGREYRIGQGNNVFVFPGLGFGSIAIGAREVTGEMLHAASRAVADHVTDEDLARGLIYPPIDRLPAVTAAVARAVARAASSGSDAQVDAALETLAWTPDYPEIVAASE
jgi:malic enzyme